MKGYVVDYFSYKNGEYYAEDVAVADIIKQWGSPCYIYSRATLERHWHAFDKALGEHPHKICYSVKANPNLAILNLFARLGSGFDIVSVGELERVLAAGGEPKKVVFSGVGKRADEMRRALTLNIYCFNVESEAELLLLNEVAKDLDKIAPISLRINPDVDAMTHPYISTGLKENKFGIPIAESVALFKKAAELPNIAVKGVDCHIGSQLTELDPFLKALEELVKLITQLSALNITIEHLDLGGGLGVRYKDETPPEPAEHAASLIKLLEKIEPSKLEIILEPGRAITANAGILVTEVQYLKHNVDKNFAIVDAAMNDLLRPSLYQAWQDILPVKPRQDKTKIYDVVGPICETADFLGKERELAIQAGDLLAVRSAGAYGFSMSSNYNSRLRPAEIMVDGSNVHLIRRRETMEELYESESILP